MQQYDIIELHSIMKLSIHTYHFYVACLLEHILLVEKLNYTIDLTNLEGALRFTISIIIKHGSTLNLKNAKLLY